MGLPRQLPCFSWAPCSCSCFVTTQPARRPRDSAFPASPTASCMLMHQSLLELAVVRGSATRTPSLQTERPGKGGASFRAPEPDSGAVSSPLGVNVTEQVEGAERGARGNLRSTLAPLAAPAGHVHWPELLPACPP